MQTAVPLACFLSLIRPPGVQYENALLQIAPVDKSKCPYIKDNNDVGFQLFTRHNPTEFQELILGDDEKLFASNMDYNDHTVLYFHAWMEQPDDSSGLMVREAYMQRGDTNVIMVDAQHLEAGPWYFTAAQNTWYIGRFAAQFVDYLASRGLNLNKTHLIGHSLGAHAAGVAGSALKSGRVARITGLDPALPLFDNLPLEQRLDTTDAHFVDIIHTDAGIFGYKAPMGHADFYPNGGISPQPGCELEVVLPKQLLLNKCDGRSQTHGFYSFYLTSNQKTHLKRKNLESNLQKLFAFIQSVTNSKHEDIKKKVNNDTNNDDHDIMNITDDTHNTNNSEVALQNETISKHSGPKYDSITDILKTQDDKDKSEEIEDQVAEASEQDLSQTELNQDILKDKEIESIIKDSEEFVLLDSKTGTDVKDIQTGVEVNETQHQDKHIEALDNERLRTVKRDDATKFTLLNAELSTSDDIGPTDTLTNKHVDRQESNTDILLYKDPCEGDENTGYEAANVLPKQKDTKHISKGKPDRKDKSKPLNILKVLENTYRISQIISSLRQIKINNEETTKHVVKRQKRYLPFLNGSGESNNILFRMLDFLIKNRKNVLPVFTVMREINTLVRSANGELNHYSREQNNFIGATPVFNPVRYDLELGNGNKATAFIKRLLGLSPNGDRLSISSRK